MTINPVVADTIYPVDPPETHTIVEAREVDSTTVSGSRREPPSLEEQQQGEEEACPLLQGAPVTCLPPRYRSLLMDDGNNNGCSWEDKHVVSFLHRESWEQGNNNNVVFYPGHMPSTPGMYLCFAFPFLIMLVFFCSTVFNNTKLKACLVAVFAYVLFCIGICAYRSHKKRSLLYARDYNGNRKTWPGNWKAGMYLVGGLALLHFNGKRAWLFPMESIVELKQETESKSPARIILKIRSPHPEKEETLQEYVLNLNNFVFPTKGKEIRCWYEHFTKKRTIIRDDGEELLRVEKRITQVEKRMNQVEKRVA